MNWKSIVAWCGLLIPILSVFLAIFILLIVKVGVVLVVLVVWFMGSLIYFTDMKKVYKGGNK